MGIFSSDPQPQGQEVEIPKATDSQIWGAKGSVNMDPGRITTHPQTKGK